ENNSQYSEIENTLLNVDYKDIIEKAYTFENIANLLNNTFFETTLKSMESSDRTYHLLLIVPVDKTKNSYETKVIFDMEKKLILNVEYLYGDTNLYEIPEVNNIYYKYKYV